jgi:bla regulator protein blaR1
MIAPVSWASLWNSAVFIHLWQSTIFVVVIWLLTLALRSNAAQTRYRLWMMASAKFLIPFSLLVAAGQSLHLDSGSTVSPHTFSSAVESIGQPLFATTPFAANAAATVSYPPAAPAPVYHPVSVLGLLAVIWAAGAIFPLARWMRSWWRIHKALRSSSPLELSFAVPVRVVPGRIEPGVFGVFRPVLLLPGGLSDHLSPSQLEAILAHESCHVRRRDNLSAALHMVVEVLFWFHPAVWWIEARLVEERERACDETVLASRGEPLSYAEGILKVCEFYVQAPMSCMSGVAGSDLKKRLVRVMSQHRGRPLGSGMKVLLATAALAAVGLPLSFGIVRPQPAAKPNHSIVGTWQGTLHLPAANLRRVLKIEKSPAGKLTAMFFSIGQEINRLQPSSISFQKGVLQYAIQVGFIDEKYTGKMSADGNSIRGTSTIWPAALPERERSVSLIFERATHVTASTIPPTAPPLFAPMPANATPGIKVATINPTKPGTRRHYLTWEGNRLVVAGFTLDDLIASAYNLSGKQIINGPGWMSSDKFDITARPTVAGTPSDKQLNEMVKALLADRFQLNTHAEQKTMSAYILTVAQGGPKMTKDNTKSRGGGLLFGPPMPTLRVHNATMKEFRNAMQSVVLDRPVVNNTGLTGRWNFSLHWTPDASQFIGVGWKMPSPSDPAKAAPPLFTAIREQLGLKLETGKAAVPVLVVDHVKHPSAN